MDSMLLMCLAITFFANSGRLPSVQLTSRIGTKYKLMDSTLLWMHSYTLKTKNVRNQGKSQEGRGDAHAVTLEQGFFLVNRFSRWLLNECAVNK